MSYARADHALGECARSGRRLKLSRMVRDGVTGLLVDPAWYEPPLIQPPTELHDPQTLRDPAPERSIPPGEGTQAPALTFDPF